MAKVGRKLSENEWAIIQTVWELQPCTAPTVQETLWRSKKWAYTTVKTMMDRMVRKGLLATKKMRNLYLYRAAVTQTQAKKNEIAGMLKRAFDGTLTPMVQFLMENDQISDREYAELETLIKNRKRKRSRAKKK
jgi:BlaI family penicillinase repressor